MGLHGGASGLWIMTLDGLENLLVMKLPTLRASPDAENSQALFAQQSHDGIDQRKNNRVRRRFGQRQVKIEIGFNEGIGIPSRIIHYFNGLSHRCEILIIGSDRCQSRDFRLQNFPYFHQVSQAVRLAALDNPVQRPAHRVRGPIRDKSSAPRKRVDQTLFLKGLDGFAYCRPADAELPRKIALRGQLAALAQFALADGFLNLLNDLLVEPRSLDNFVQEIPLTSISDLGSLPVSTTKTYT